MTDINVDLKKTCKHFYFLRFKYSSQSKSVKSSRNRNNRFKILAPTWD